MSPEQDKPPFFAAQEPSVEQLATAKLPLKDFGLFDALSFRSLPDDTEHLVLTFQLSVVSEDTFLPVFIRQEQGVTDLLGGMLQQTPAQVDTIKQGLAAIVSCGQGLLLYLREQAGESLLTPAPLSSHSLGIAASILRSMGITNLRLLNREPEIADYFLRATQFKVRHLPPPHPTSPQRPK